MKKDKFSRIFVLASLAIFLLNFLIIIIFTVLDMNATFYSALNVASLVISFVSFLVSSFFSFSVYQQAKNQNEINKSLPRKDDQYIISNYSLFNIETEISFFTLKDDEKDILLREERYLHCDDYGREDIVRLVFLPTESVNMPTYKVLVRSIDFFSGKNEKLYSATADSPLDGEYAPNILNRGYNCICVDLLADMSAVQNLFHNAGHLELKLDIISVFNVKMTATFYIYLAGLKDLKDNPDVQQIEDLTTYVIHHANYKIEDKTILTYD